MKKLIALMLLLGWGAVQAAPVTWTLNDVTFDDGGNATGYFDYDVDTNQFTNINISSATTSWPNDGDYAPPVSSAGNAASLSVLAGGGFGTVIELTLIFDSNLTNAGGAIALSTSSWEEERDFGSGFVIRSRTLTEGAVSAIPIPAAVWLFGSGLGLLGWFRRKAA